MFLTTLIFVNSTTAESLAPLKDPELKQWWQEHPEPAQWQAAMQEVHSKILEHYRSQPDSLKPESPIFDWFYHFQWLHLYDKLETDATTQSAFVEIGSSTELRNTLLNSLHPLDDRAAAASIYVSLYRDMPDTFPDYRHLAAAFAIVFDQEFPSNWPHHQVDSRAVPIGDTEVSKRFEYYVNANEARDMEYDLKELPAYLAKHIVDSKIELSEFTWIQEETKFNLRKIAGAFSYIIYDHPRVTNNDQYVWPHASYRLSDIKQLNGICVDQAYFGSMAGKALGIPTLYFSGQGAGGGHAWIGYLEEEDEWNTEVGRHASGNYPVGNALDPQTWRLINDAQLAQLSEGLEGEPAYHPARQLMMLAAFYSETPEYTQFIQAARTTMPELIEPWFAEAKLLQQQEGTSALKAHLRAWIDQFDDQVDYKVEAQTMLVEILKQENDPAAGDLQKDIVRQNRKKRFDLGISSGAGAILEKLDEENWEEAEKEFKRMVRKFDDQGGGNLFYSLVRPYVQSCHEAEQPEYAEKGLEYAFKKMEPRRGSILEGEFREMCEYLGIDPFRS